MIAPQPFYSDRGTPMNIKLLCQVLGEAGNSLDLLVFPTGRDIGLKNVRIIRLPNIFRVTSIPIGPSRIKLAYDILLIAFTLFLCLTKRYDAIHGVEEGGFLAVFLSRLLGKASVFDMDSSISHQLEYSGFIANPFLLRLVSRFEAWSIRRSSAVVAVCSALSHQALSSAPNANIVTIEDIPTPGVERFNPELVEELLKKYNLQQDRRVVYTGNLEPYQGIDLLLAAWKMFLAEKKNGASYKLILVGGATERVGFYEKVVKNDGIAAAVCFVGARPLEEMGAWMALGDVLVSPRSEGENTPLKIYSYMASGRPLVATRRKTHTQVLDDTTAFLAEPEPVQFGKAIYDAFNNPALAKKKGEAAKLKVEKNYSYPAFKEKLLEVYSSFVPT